MGARLASAPTDPQGNFTMSFGGYSGPVMLSMSGESYTDEATGSMMNMAANAAAANKALMNQLSSSSGTIR